jgi:hypothetical protein
MVGFGYEFGAWKDEMNPAAQSYAYFAIFNNSPVTLVLMLLSVMFPIIDHLPLGYIQRTGVARKVIFKAASELIAAKSMEKGSRGNILDCILRENQRLKSIGERNTRPKKS